MMQDNIPQELKTETVPWTVGDVAKGSLVAIAAMGVVYILAGICIIFFLSMTNFQNIANQNLSQTELLNAIINSLKAHGSLNRFLLLMFVFMAIGEGAIPLGAWLFSLRKYHCKWDSLGFKKFDIAKGIGLAIAVTALGVLLAMGWETLLNRYGIESDIDTSLFFNASGTGIVLFSIIAVLIAPFAEESFFRGFMFQGISKRTGYIWGAVISAALFATAHLSAANLVPIFILGLMLAWLYHKTKSIWPCIIVHALYNSIAVISMVKS